MPDQAPYDSLLDSLALHPERIELVDRLATGISVEIGAAAIALRICLREDADVGEVDPRLVVISADLAQPHLAGVLEAADVGALRLAIFVVGVDADESAGAVGLRNNRAALVARQELARGRAGAVILEDRLVDPRPEDVTSAQTFIERQTAELGGKKAAVGELIRVLFNTNEFLYVD